MRFNLKKYRYVTGALVQVFIFLILSACSAQQTNTSENNWTHFRGSNLNGISDVTGLPTNWNDTLNIAWKTVIGGKGWSSPVVFDNQVWCTTATPDGKKMSAVCIDLFTGQPIFDLLIFEPDTIYRIHAVNSYATPTPCIEQGYVYLHFGRYGTTCLDTRTGETVWTRNDLQCEHIQGPGSSLMLYKDFLIVHMEGSDRQYIVALNKHTGETVWMVDRPAECYEPLEYIGKKAYTTPFIINVKGRDLMISNGAAVCIAYDPMTGKEVWRIVQGEDSTIAMPVEYNGIVYFYTSFVTSEDGRRHCDLLAVNPDGRGDISPTNILWRKQSPPLQLLTPVIREGLLYTVDTKGILYCLDASSGEEVWSEKLKGKYNSSPIAADGKIYINSVNGETLVLQEGRVFNLLAKNRLEGEIWATPAIADRSLLIRTSEFLYKIKLPDQN